MEKGSKLSSLLQNLERFTSREDALVPRYTSDDYKHLRVLTSRILQCVSAQEKRIRDIVLKSGNYLDQLLYLLEHSKDKVATLNLVYTLSEAVGRSKNNKRLALLVSRGSVQILLHILVSEAKQTDCSEELLLAIHQLLAKVGPKDHKFSVKARLLQTLNITLNLLRSNCSHPQILLPVTQVLKLYAGDVVNSSFLGKNGAVSCLFKIFTLYQRKHLLLLKCSLEVLSRLVKSKGAAALAIGEGGVSILIGMFSDWQRLDTKNRHIGIRKAIVIALKNITEFKCGQQALVEADGVQVLYFACQEAIDCAELESLICMASGVVRKCFPRSHLPLSSLKNPLLFDVPGKELADGYDSAKTAKEDGSVDNDDEISSDDDRDVHKAFESDDEDEFGVSFESSYRRTWDDLMSYKPFFSELYEYDAILERLDSSINNNDLPPSTVNASLTKPLCRSSIDLRKDSRSMVSIPLAESSSTVATQCLDKNFQQNSAADLKLTSSHFSVPNLFHSDRRPVLPRGREPLGSVWSAPFNQVGSISCNLSKETSQFPCSPKSKRKSNLPKTGNGKQREKLLLKGKASKSLIDDWLSFDLSVAMSNLASTNSNSTTEENGFREKILSNPDSDDDDDSALLFGRKEAVDDRVEDPAMYSKLAAATVSVGVFNKLAYAELYGHSVPPFKEPLYEKKLGIQRQMILEDIERFINPEQLIDRVVFDLDQIISSRSVSTNLQNDDELRVNRRKCFTDALVFNSLFESGNLRKAIQMRQYEYDLILTPDVNTNRFHQWFYFEVSNVERNVRYRFNIINCEKMNSQFNFGMQPVMFSVSDAMRGRPYWSRVGTKICYYKNHFVRSSQTNGGIRGKTYYTASFTITFRHDRDVCYIAYHYPYTYTLLQYHLKKWGLANDSADIYLRNQVLCKTVAGNTVPLLTLTSNPISYDKEGICQMKNRPYIFLTSRVHPGESNASWTMKGTIDFLLSDHPTAKLLRDNYIFKIVPMLNPDGVINGNHRCSLVAEDLNRRWFCPCPERHPTIYHTKGLLQYLTALDRAPLVFCDYHGHSRRKNVFLYGCSPSQSWIKDDFENPAVLPNLAEDSGYKTLPRILHSIAPAFSLNSCSFAVERVKESTARVVVWRQMGVLRSYTMETTYCGCDQGIYKGRHINTRNLQKVGQKLMEAIAKLKVKQTLNGTAASILSPDTNDDIALSQSGGGGGVGGCVAAKTASDALPNSSGSISTPSDIDEYLSSNEPELEDNVEDGNEDHVEDGNEDRDV